MHSSQAPYIGRGGNVLSGGLVGLGASALVDELVLHRILHWRHMHNIDTMSTTIGILFVAVGLFAAIAGLVVYRDLRRHYKRRPRVWGAAFLLSAGVFQLWSSAIQYGTIPRGGHPHGLHLIGIVVLLLAGAALLPRRPSRRARPAVEREPVRPHRVR